MKILIACEESQTVCKAFREIGHQAFSCDIIEQSGGYPEWHIQQDVTPLLNGNCSFCTNDGMRHEIIGRWDMIIAHPPCTYMSNAGAVHMFRGGKLNEERFEKGMRAKKFFLQCLNADCEKICVENPRPLKIIGLPIQSQIIQPYEYGHPYSKATYLWLKGIKPLVPTKIVKSIGSYVQYFAHNAKTRSKTFGGIAKAMAEQWGNKEE